MTDLPMKMTQLDVKKFQWCAKIALHLTHYDWLFCDAYEYAEVLHYDYIELSGEYQDPMEVLEEEMTYYG